MRRREATWLRNPDSKHSRLFYFMGPCFLVENLQKKRIKLSKFSACNDTFELASYSLGHKKIREKQRLWKIASDNKVGLLCLSHSWRNPAMWGHYADKGTGACLVFDVPKELCNPVVYRGNRARVSEDFEFPDYAKDPDNFIDLCSTKSLHWSYEEEIRVFWDLADTIEEGGNQFVEFNKELKLVGVINGYSPKVSEKEIREHLSERDNFFQCRPAFQSFEVVKQRNEENWK